MEADPPINFWVSALTTLNSQTLATLWVARPGNSDYMNRTKNKSDAASGVGWGGGGGAPFSSKFYLVPFYPQVVSVTSVCHLR